MKYIILFLLFIITIAVFKKPAQHKETFLSALKESATIKNKIDLFSNSGKELLDSLTGSYKESGLSPKETFFNPSSSILLYFFVYVLICWDFFETKKTSIET